MDGRLTENLGIANLGVASVDGKLRA